MTDSENASSVYSVSQALFQAKTALEGVVVKILGEVSEVNNKPGYKAVYFSIKDENSTLPCMMWMNRYNASGLDLKVGSLVEISGRFSLYAAKGRMNFDVFSITLAGEGNLRLKVANLAKKLEAEGLMNPERKREIPKYPEKIGLVTSPRGAAVHDVLRTLRRRFPLAKVYLAGVPVEGIDAANNIIEGINALSTLNLDVILLVRGGGSFEDLMPFNDEKLAYTIAYSPVPIVTGIGHEPDTSIADMVADLRSSTPTAAAESISSSMPETLRMLNGFSQKMESVEQKNLSEFKRRVATVEMLGMFREPLRLFADEAQSIDDLSSRLSRALPDYLTKMDDKTSYLALIFKNALSRACVKEKNHVNVVTPRFNRIGKTLLESYKAEFGLSASRIEDLSPLKILSRGYSIARKDDGEVISKVSDVTKGSQIEILVSNGYMNCEVKSLTEMEITLDSFDTSGIY